VPALPGQESKWDRIVATAAVPGEVSEDLFPAMVEEIERRLGIAGHVSIIGGTLTWSPATQGQESRRVVVQVAVRDGQTAVRIQENLEVEGLRALAIPAGILTSGVFGLVFARLLGMGEPAGPILAALCAAIGAFLSVRSVTGFVATIREPKLQELAGALAALASAAQQVPALVPGEDTTHSPE
jgi:hypothetical protein